MKGAASEKKPIETTTVIKNSLKKYYL